MGIKTVYIDDFDGKELPDSTEPFHLAVGEDQYTLYLSEDNITALETAVEPFIMGVTQDSIPELSQTVSAKQARRRAIQAFAEAENKIHPDRYKIPGDRGGVSTELEHDFDFSLKDT